MKLPKFLGDVITLSKWQKCAPFSERSVNYFIALVVCEKTNENVQFCKHGKITVLTL